MSSLAAARADGFYHPPEYRAEHGSLNKFRGSHPLGVRAKKIDQGILVIRFEMPFKVWCTKCESIIAKGVRFNAEKKCVGKYYTTSIWEFTMKCYHCDNKYKIRTDPQECEYKLIEGLRMKTETYDAEDAVTMEFMDEDERAKLQSDSMHVLEKKEEGERKARGKNRELEDILDLQSERSDFYALNSRLRSSFRIYKKECIEAEMRERGESPPKTAIKTIEKPKIPSRSSVRLSHSSSSRKSSSSSASVNPRKAAREDILEKRRKLLKRIK
eukprot:GHVN01063522.1.p1 GENE.GHVN01063522.1~~GHVN01063522.1.p1  ORF type:complete len:271 (+),score=41.83 GHVN01063522.1:85-897(+)